MFQEFGDIVTYKEERKIKTELYRRETDKQLYLHRKSDHYKISNSIWTGCMHKALMDVNGNA